MFQEVKPQSKLTRALILMAESGQMEGFKRQLPTWILSGFIGWLLGILTALSLISV
jgi:hypothetical protein